MMQLDEKVPIANPMVVFREEFDDWAILFDPDTGKAFGINPVGASIWRQLDGKHCLSDLTTDINRGFQGIPEDLNAHIEKFLQELMRLGFAGYEV
jgi:SynChlorMet cassette protein ScmD